MSEKNFPAPLMESTDAQLSESLKEQARRHMPDSFASQIKSDYEQIASQCANY